ncbi:hypothetical protein CGLO_14778 [Colletotrichum gloeosporioides Cg-14]|uniref:Uncharacterized protein n=1 Tax=Colletotrichum gloeosporioides (strain Cg-14) TaxID=1237896 RepID=T0K077_COLGC|nr:hypothetical protein CGLO_14778 [Colletotrichum gloeosporioides Cg-14]
MCDDAAEPRGGFKAKERRQVDKWVVFWVQDQVEYG